MIFYFISYMYIKPQAKKRQPLGTIVLMQAERSYHFDHWLHVSNQRTSGPVNARLTPGPGIYFKAFIYVYRLITLLICCKV